MFGKINAIFQGNPYYWNILEIIIILALLGYQWDIDGIQWDIA